MSKIQISKQITTISLRKMQITSVYSICQRYRFQSKLQQGSVHKKNTYGCIQYVKDTDFKANYNIGSGTRTNNVGVFNMSKIQISKQITTVNLGFRSLYRVYSICQRYRFQSKLQHAKGKVTSSKRCIQYVKDTDFKANYNTSLL